jgi:hypothetical protein
MAVLTKIETPLGTVIASSDGQSLTGLWFAGQKYECAFVEGPVWDDSLPLWKDVKQALDAYFQGVGDVTSSVPIVFVGGTAFQKAVWDVLTEIPYQIVWTYKDVAERVGKKLGRKTSSRAVGTAIGRNPISLFVPCHRIVATTGALTGYAGGVERKRALLMLEGHSVVKDRVMKGERHEA